MATIYKKGRDKKKRHAPWYIDYFDHPGKRRTRKGFTDKSRTEQLAAKLENEALLRKSGMIDPKQEEFANQRKSVLESHLQDFEIGLQRRISTAKHVRLTISRIRRVVRGCEFETIGDISADDVECFLSEARMEGEFGHKTYNHYVQAFEQFCSWLMAKGRVSFNPVVGLERLNCETDVRHRRRALSPDEFEKLVLSAQTSDKLIQCYDGETRAKIYVLSNMTGLRRTELASLTPSSFKLQVHPATLTVAAKNSKHRKLDVLPLHPDLIVMLREWLVAFGPNDFLFPKLAKRRTWLMVKKDLERVGIPYETDDGIADFHAVGRHTYITELLRNGVSLPEARELARHSDVNMTMRYTHIGIKDQAKAIAKLPNSCQHIVSTPGDSSSPEQSRAVAGRQDEGAGQVDATSAGVSPSDTKKQTKSPPVEDGDLWRRRESNPRPETFPCKLLRV